MKALLIIIVSISLSLGVSAQRKGGFYHSRPSVVVVPSFGYGFGYGYPLFGYPYGYPYGYPHGYPYGARRTPYKLSLEIQTIKVDYKNQIKAARKDRTISHTQKRQEIRNLKAERDQAILSAERNYRPSGGQNNGSNNQYRSPNNNNNYQNNNNSYTPGNS